MNRSTPVLSRPVRYGGAALVGAMLLTLALPLPAGQLYQWKDAKGVTHYSDAPPSGQPHQTRSISLKDPSPAAAPKPVANSDCSNARSNLKLLQGTAPVLVDEDKDGKPDRELNAQERTRRTRLAEAQIETYCGSAEAVVQGDSEIRR